MQKHNRLKVKAGKGYFKQNRARVAILISGKLDLKTKTVKRDKVGHYLGISGQLRRCNNYKHVCT